jgi:tetratricopeptide (TPR) repeat protein
MDLTPEERQRIFEEEKIRAEARAQVEKVHKEQVLQARRASRRKPSAKKVILAFCLAMALLTAIAWRVRLTLANRELVAMLQEAEAYVGTTPSDDDWKDISLKAVVMGLKDGDHRGAALLYIRSLRYAAANERAASSYRSLGWELGQLDLVEAAERCDRLAVGLAPSDDLARKFLADMLVKQKKYTEAEPLYLELLPRASTALDRAILNGSLAKISAAAGRKQEADDYAQASQRESGGSPRER